IIPSNSSRIYPQISSPTYGVTNYEITQSVKYQVELNFTLTHKAGIGSYIFKFARFDNRVPNSTYTKYTPPYQESILLNNEIEGCKPNNIRIGHYDKFNNTYDSFNATLLPLSPILSKVIPKVSFNQKYIIKLNAIKFQDIEDSEIGSYDQSDEVFELYCNNPEQYYEQDDPSLISLSNSIVDSSDNPIDKAEKIFDWVSDNLDYNGNLPPQEKGALWAYNNLEGDCSEYSSLMVTLLRIQNIPARKVTGFLLSNNPSIRPKTGDIWTFHASESTSNLIGHAWVEYYIPNIGWIACDPTWNSGSNYFNRIDFLRFNLNVGANFFFPPSSTVSEYLNPLFSHSLGASYEYDYTIKITVIASNILTSDLFLQILTLIVIIAIFGIIITIVVIKRKNHRKFKGGI
ncbi:MAG: transglutaminase-like domain-containing protein, partial [Promethearchaeota archaeon]